MFTQPLMYSIIKKTKPVLVQYAEKLVNEGIVTTDQFKVREFNKTAELKVTLDHKIYKRIDFFFQ